MSASEQARNSSFSHSLDGSKNDIEMRNTDYERSTDSSLQVHKEENMELINMTYSESIFFFMKERDPKVILNEVITLKTTGLIESLEKNISFPETFIYRDTNQYKILEKKLIKKGFNNKMMVVRRLSRIRDLQLYITNTIIPVDLSDWNSYKVIAMMTFYPILITFTVILVPLGGFQHIDHNDNVQINKIGYLVFQAVYALLAYNCMVRLFSEAYVGVLPDMFLWVVMPLGFGTLVILILYSCLLFLDYPGKQPHGKKPTAMGGIYAYAIWYQFVYIWCIYLYYILKRQYFKPHDSKLNLLSNTNGNEKQISNSSYKPSSNGSIISSISQAEASSISTENDSSTTDINNEANNLGLPQLSLYPRVLLLSLAIAGLYSFCAWFTTFFEQETANSTFGKNTSLILLSIFVFVVCFGTMIVRVLGNYVDQGLSPNSPSLNVIAGMMADTYLIVYYRNLFAYVDGWPTFLEFSLVAVILELVTFQYSVTDSYRELHNTIISYGIRKLQETNNINVIESFKINCAFLYCTTHGWRDGEIFVNKNALMLGYRFILRSSTTVSYIIFQLFLRYGYNSPFYSVDKQHYSDDRFSNLLAFIALSFVFECIVMYFPEKSLRDKTGIGILARTISFFQKAPNSAPYVLFFIWALGHINSDVFVAKIDYTHQGRLL
jgi:hypothetical protein